MRSLDMSVAIGGTAPGLLVAGKIAESRSGIAAMHAHVLEKVSRCSIHVSTEDQYT